MKLWVFAHFIMKWANVNKLMLEFLLICNNLYQLSIVMFSTFILVARSLTFNRLLLEIVNGR